MICPQVAFLRSIPLEQLPSTWGNLTHALGGLLCSSLNVLTDPSKVAERHFAVGQDGGVRYTRHRRVARLCYAWTACPAIVCNASVAAIKPTVLHVPAHDVLMGN